MFEGIPEEARLKVLLKFVKSLIENSPNAEIFKLNEILVENKVPPEFSPISKEEIKEQIKQKVKEKLGKPKDSFGKEEFKESLLSVERKVPVQGLRRPVNFGVKRVLRIPKVNLPRHLSDVRPAPTNKVSIDLGKLNPLINDSNVRTLETEGESEPVYVTGNMGRKPTSIKLSKAEIDEVIDRFSKEAKIPKSNGVYKVAVGKLLLTAMISGSVSPRFVIEKMAPEKPAYPR